jgi:nitric oxide synthase oxygenase domain/subunit
MIVEWLLVAVQFQQSNSHATGNRLSGKWAYLAIPPLRPA